MTAKIKSALHDGARGPLEVFFTAKPYVVTFKRLCRGVLCSAVVDERKRELRIISLVRYYYYHSLNIISRASLPLFNIISHTQEKRRGEE